MKRTASLGIVSALVFAAAPAHSADGPDYLTYAQCAAVAAMSEHVWKMPAQRDKKPGAADDYKDQRTELTRLAIAKAKSAVGASKATEEVNIMIVRFITYFMADMPNRYQPQFAHCRSIDLITVPA